MQKSRLANLSTHHRQAILAPVQRQNLRIDLANSAQLAKLDKIGRVRVLEIGNRMATKHPSMLVSRQRGIERHGATNGAIALAMQGISEAVSINCTQLVLNQIPLWLLDDRLAGSAASAESS